MRCDGKSRGIGVWPAGLLLVLGVLVGPQFAAGAEPPPSVAAEREDDKAAAGTNVADRPAGSAAATWTLRSIARRAAAGLDAVDPGEKPALELPFLHLRVAFRDAGTDPKLHEFRVTDGRGKTVAEPYGYHREKSLLVFEGDWTDLRGLYLEGHRLRVPLFAEAPSKAPAAVKPTETRPAVASPKQSPDVIDSTAPPRSPGGTVVVRPMARPQETRPATEPPIVAPPRPTTVQTPGDTIVVRPPNPAADGKSGRSGGQRAAGAGPGEPGEPGGPANSSGSQTPPGGAGHSAQDGPGSPWDIDPPMNGDSPRGPPQTRDSTSGRREPAPQKTQKSRPPRPSRAAQAPGPTTDPAEGPTPGGDEAPLPGMTPSRGEGAGSDGKGVSGSSEGASGPGAQGAGNDGQRNRGQGNQRGDSTGAGAMGVDGIGPGASGPQSSGPRAAGPDRPTARSTGPNDRVPGAIRRPGMPDTAARGYEGPGYESQGSLRGGLGGELIQRRPKGVGPTPGPGPLMPSMVLYLACSTGGGKGRVYQVDESGGVLGIIDLPYAPTGIALHRQNAVIVVSPRDGGYLWRIDDAGRVTPILQRDPALTDPVDVAIAADSDTLVVADSQSHSLWVTTAEGGPPKLYRRMTEPAKLDRPAMSVAVTLDRNVLYGTNNAAGVYRFTGDSSAAGRAPQLPGCGAVAADTISLQWAATQSHDRILVYEGETQMKSLQLPAGKALAGNGMLSFAPASSVVTAVRPNDNPAGHVWFLQFGTKTNAVNALFRWQKEPVLDFVVGPRMPWNGKWPGGKRLAPPFPR